MDENELPPIPPNHAIHEIWALNRLDLAAIKTLLKRHAHHLEIKNEEPQALTEWIKRKIRETCRYNDANKAFGFTQDKTKRQGSPGLTYLEKQQQCSIGYRVAQLINEMPSKNKAYDLAAEEFGIKPSKARYCFNKYMKV